MPKVDTTVKELVDMVGRGELRLPEMQRPYVWKAPRVRDLLDSLYRGYPSGAILVWETDQEAPTRDLAAGGQSKNAFASQKLLLDGQQRVTSLCSVLKGEAVQVRGRKRPIDILFNLEHPEGPPVELTEVDDDSDSPILDFDDDAPEDDEEEDDIQERLKKRTFVVSSKALLATPTWVRVSDVFLKNDWAILKPLGIQPDDPRYEKYEERLQKVRGIQNYPYVMHVLDRRIAYEEVAEIFVRVNSLGVKLRGSDLALAQVTARWQNSLKLFEDFADEIDEKSWFTLDLGLLVRSMVVFATGQSRFKTLQGVSVERMKKGWAQAQDAVRFAVNFLRSNAGVEDESLLASPMLIIGVAAAGHARDFKLTKAESRALTKWALVANARGHFSRGSTETVLDQDLAVLLRGGSIDELFPLLLRQFGRLHIEAGDFIGKNSRSPLFSTAFLALKANGASDWWSGLSLSLAHQGRLHYIEYHHVFPKAVLVKKGFEKAQINEIANFAFISGRANRGILAKEPRSYLPGIIEKRGTEALEAQLIPTDPQLWEVKNYPAFLEWRRERLAERINQLLKVAQ